MHTTRRNIGTFARRQVARAVLLRLEIDVLIINIIARIQLRTTDLALSSCAVKIALKVLEPDIRHEQLRCAWHGTIIARVLSNSWTSARAVHKEVSESDVGHIAVPTAVARAERRRIVGLIRGLVDLDADPAFDVRRVGQIVVVANDGDIPDHDVLNGGIDVVVLAQTADRHAIPSHARGVLDKDVVRARLDGDAIVTTLVHEIPQNNIVNIHRIESIRVLHPIVSIRRIHRRSIVIDVLE